MEIVKIGDITFKFIEYDRGLPYKCEKNHLIEEYKYNHGLGQEVEYNCNICKKAYSIIKPYFTIN